MVDYGCYFAAYTLFWLVQGSYIYLGLDYTNDFIDKLRSQRWRLS